MYTWDYKITLAYKADPTSRYTNLRHNFLQTWFVGIIHTNKPNRTFSITWLDVFLAVHPKKIEVTRHFFWRFFTYDNASQYSCSLPNNTNKEFKLEVQNSTSTRRMTYSESSFLRLTIIIWLSLKALVYYQLNKLSW